MSQIKNISQLSFFQLQLVTCFFFLFYNRCSRDFELLISIVLQERVHAQQRVFCQKLMDDTEIPLESSNFL